MLTPHPKNSMHEIIRMWNTDGSLTKRELLEILKGIGDDDEIYLTLENHLGERFPVEGIHLYTPEDPHSVELTICENKMF